MSVKQILKATTLGLALAGLGSVPAHADLKLCNNTPNIVQVAVGYKDKEGWASEGWWTVKSNSCSGIMKGPLIARYYYIYAVDDKKVAAWPGKALMCTKEKAFTIRGIDKCEDRGYLQRGFFEVDTGDKADWTVSLTGDKAAATATEAPKTP
jgi:uncharacterized membrane protein